MENLELIDENETEQLYRMENDLFNTVVLVCDGVEFCLSDMQSSDFPLTLADAMYYDWLKLEDIFEWHP